MPDCGIYATLWVPFLFYILPPVFLLTLVPFRYYSFRRRNRHFFPHPHDILSGQSVLWGISIPWNGSSVHAALHNTIQPVCCTAQRYAALHHRLGQMRPPKVSLC